jgi:hypothetical protein
MKKKTRTGLQSKVSHIFAGVPIPKKRRSRSGEPEQKPETKDSEQTPAVQIAAEEHPSQQPAVKKTPAEQHPVSESPAAEPSAQQIPQAQKQAKEISDEEKFDIQPQAEELILGQPPVIQLPDAQPSIPFGQTIELPEIDEPVKAVQEPFSGKPAKAGIAEQKVVKIPRKASARPKDKRLASKAGPSSRRQTTMVILVIALSILLFFLLFKPFSKSSYNITGPEVTQTVESQSAAQMYSVSTAINWQRPDVYPTNIRDPMILGSQQQFYSDTWKPNLVGLVYNENQKYAIIGTEILQEGEEINGVKVLKINKDSVEFERDGQKWTQEVQSENN